MDEQQVPNTSAEGQTDEGMGGEGNTPPAPPTEGGM